MRAHRLKRSGLLDDMVDRRKTDFALHTGSNVLVYLIHGVTGTPAEMHYVGKELARHGWDVYATTLPGHCTRLRDLVKTSERDWRGHVEKQLAFIRDRYQYVFVVGLSAGALLALDASTVVDV
ncbi:MAG TPA: alpha/beta fold hydrolase, partial [Nitrospiraceae bacterium]